MAGRFYPIKWAEMHDFCTRNGLKLLNPLARRHRSGYVTDWARMNLLAPFIVPETVIAVPAIDLYQPVKTWEMVYGKRVYMQGSPRQLTLRIYTTIDPETGIAREKGSDAIRVALFWREILTDSSGNESAAPSKLIGGDTKCLRVESWASNLGGRLEHWPDLIGPECPRCERPMVQRDGKHGAFWGCTGWRKDGPSCNMIINVGQEDAPRCPQCHDILVVRKGSRGPFYGCRSYPTCRYTESCA